MTVRPSDVIKIALAEVGYHEKASNSNLDNKTANSGNKNYQKYGRDLYAAGYYNGNKNGYAWCDQFVDWCFFVACGRDKQKAESIECQTGELGASTTYSKRYYEMQNRFDKTPKIGDQIFFLFSGNTGVDHTGIVINVTDTEITTVEGNSNEAVRKNTYKRTCSAILGYGHPKYDAYDEEATEKGEEKAVNITLHELAKGSTGNEVRTLQRLLKSFNFKDANGKALDVDGDFGAKTEYALKAFQKEKKLTVDGVCGINTWTKLLK